MAPLIGPAAFRSLCDRTIYFDKPAEEEGKDVVKQRHCAAGHGDESAKVANEMRLVVQTELPGERLIDADGNWRCGPLSGYRVDYLNLDKLHCRFAMPARDGFHILINIIIPPNQADALLPAVDAVFDSIRAIDE